MKEEKENLGGDEVEGLLITDSGLEYSEHKFVKKDTAEELTVRLFRSMRPDRLKEEEETYDEYRFRRKMGKDIIKHYRKGRLVWNPYPFGANMTGFTCNAKNREIMKEMMEKMEANAG